MRKKSQMEIVGLLIIVILITLVLFFVLVFLLDSSDSSVAPDDSFAERQLIENFATAFFNSETVCKDANDKQKNMGEVLEQCILDLPTFECGDYYDACVFFNDTLKEMVGDTFDEYGLRYFINVSRTSPSGTITYLANECAENRQGFELFTPKNVREGFTNVVVFFKIRICT